MITALLAVAPVSYAKEMVDDDQAEGQEPSGPQPQAQALDSVVGDMRDQLEARGIEINPTDTFDVFGNTTGGIKKGIKPLNQFDLNAVFDGNKLANIEGLTGDISILENAGTPNRSLVGSAQRIDNLETYRPGVSIYDAWLQQNWLKDQISLLGGVYDFNSEFYTVESSNFFLNTGFELGPELADSSRDGSLVFPASLPALRLRVQPTQQIYIETAVADGSNSRVFNNYSADQQNDRVPDIALVEAGFLPDNNKQSDKFALGVWETRQLNSSLNTTHNNEGAYFISQYGFYQPVKNDDRGLKGFFKTGYADGNGAHFDYSLSTGLLYTGLFPTRDKGQLGFAFSEAHTTADFNKELVLNSEPIAHGEEKVLELSYKDFVLPWLSAQPDMQYVISPDDVNARKNAYVVGARLEANF